MPASGLAVALPATRLARAVSDSAVVQDTTGGELATLLFVLGPADGSSGRGPVVALPWAPPWAGSTALLRQSGRRAAATVKAAWAAAGARRRPTVVRFTRGALNPGLGDSLRRSAGSGFVAHLPVPGEPSLLEWLLRDAGATPTDGLRVGADGAVRALVQTERGRGMLRMGLGGSPADPSRAAEGLRLVHAMTAVRAPALLAEGQRTGVVWTLEEALPGKRPRALTPAIAEQVARFTAAFPRADERVDVCGDATVLAEAAPHCATGIRRIAHAVAASPLADRAQLRHGDLWIGNLLVQGEVVTGAIDWDAWQPAGVPGVDLLHLIGTAERIRDGSSLGEVWLRRPWDAPAFIGLARRYWPEWAADSSARAAVGAAWWLGQLAADLRRNPTLAADEGWLQRNVAAVAARPG